MSSKGLRLGSDTDLRLGCLGWGSGCFLGLGVLGLDLDLRGSLGLVPSTGLTGLEEGRVAGSEVKPAP